MFLVSLAGPAVFAKEITQICLSFGSQTACAGSRGTGEGLRELQNYKAKTSSLFRCVQLTKVNVTQVTLLLDKSSYAKWIVLLIVSIFEGRRDVFWLN